MTRFGNPLWACLAGIAWLVAQTGAVADEPAWKQEFERICIQVEAASGLSEEHLRELIGDSERLLERLSTASEPQAKIYTMRLKKCRDFFSFMLDVKQQDARSPDTGG